MHDAPLWRAEDQSVRLAELTAATEDRAKELPLRRDIRSLGTLLGRVLVDQSGEPLFKTVEQLRRLLIQSRAHSNRAQTAADSNTDEMKQAREIIENMSIAEAYRVPFVVSVQYAVVPLGDALRRRGIVLKGQPLSNELKADMLPITQNCPCSWSVPGLVKTSIRP